LLGTGQSGPGIGYLQLVGAAQTLDCRRSGSTILDPTPFILLQLLELLGNLIDLPLKLCCHALRFPFFTEGEFQLLLEIGLPLLGRFFEAGREFLRKKKRRLMEDQKFTLDDAPAQRQEMSSQYANAAHYDTAEFRRHCSLLKSPSHAQRPIIRKTHFLTQRSGSLP
jgi:hypothetical protein